MIQPAHQKILQALADKDQSDFSRKEILEKTGYDVGDPLVQGLFSNGLLLFDEDALTYRIPEGIRECVLATK
ncbi:hypothetical protein D6833_11710 [Candidatus Parcubacteria bacterium]|nr:MAG: hypothetical protein D6833_11710 [Candidatus Parcubacteria bacterium]